MKKKSFLIQADPSQTITIPEDGIPVIEGENGSGSLPDVVKAVNFLRCGCPFVQVFYPDTHYRKEGEEILTRAFKGLALTGERFVIRVEKEDAPVVIIHRQLDGRR